MILTSTKLRHYQRWLKEKYQEIESLYYEQVDELTQKLGDLDLPGLPPEMVPNFDLTTYTFIDQWEDGELSSEEVYDIFLKMQNQDNFRVAARAKIIKPLQKYMMEHEHLADFFKHTISGLETDVVPKMIKYLDMMMKTFKHMSDIDNRQIPVTWVEQSFEKGEVFLRHSELSLNQAIKQIESYVARMSDQTFFFKDQVVVFDQITSMDERTIHWIFAPRTYIELLMALFKIRAELKGQAEEEYMKGILKGLL